MTLAQDGSGAGDGGKVGIVLRVLYDELEVAGGDAGCVYKGSAFSGIAYEVDSVGSLVCEEEFVDGVREGMSRMWHDNGVLAEETRMHRDSPHGESRQWWPNGQLRSVAEFEHSMCVRRSSWSEAGEALEEYHIENDEKAHSTLQILRRGLPAGW